MEQEKMDDTQLKNWLFKENMRLEKESPGYLLVAGLPVIGPQE